MQVEVALNTSRFFVREITSTAPDGPTIVFRSSDAAGCGQGTIGANGVAITINFRGLASAPVSFQLRIANSAPIQLALPVLTDALRGRYVWTEVLPVTLADIQAGLVRLDLITEDSTRINAIQNPPSELTGFVNLLPREF